MSVHGVRLSVLGFRPFWPRRRSFCARTGRGEVVLGKAMPTNDNRTPRTENRERLRREAGSRNRGKPQNDEYGTARPKLYTPRPISHTVSI